MQLPSPVGIPTPAAVVPPPSVFSSDSRYRVNPFLLNSVVLTGAFQSVGLSVPSPTLADLYVDWRIFVTGAVGAVAGVQLKMVPTNASSGGSVLTARGPAGALTALQQKTFLANVASPAFCTFDISAEVGVEISLSGILGGARAPGVFDLQMQNAGAGVYTVAVSIVEACLR